MEPCTLPTPGSKTSDLTESMVSRTGNSNLISESLRVMMRGATPYSACWFLYLCIPFLGNMVPYPGQSPEHPLHPEGRRSDATRCHPTADTRAWISTAHSTVFLRLVAMLLSDRLMDKINDSQGHEPIFTSSLTSSPSIF